MRTTKGEQTLINLFRRAGIWFEREKTFDDLRGGKYRYDFYLPDYNILIEFDGTQHFHQVAHFQKRKSDFLKAQEHDRRKNSYALSNQIRLYRIPYWELENLKSARDLFRDDFLVRTKWHNDEIWRKHQNYR